MSRCWGPGEVRITGTASDLPGAERDVGAVTSSEALLAGWVLLAVIVATLIVLNARGRRR